MVVRGALDVRTALIAARILQGIGAAPMLPLSLAIVCNAFPASEQARALGVWAGVSALALAIGPLAGGRPGRNRLAGDLLDQPAGRRDRDLRSRRWRRPSRPIPGLVDRVDFPGLLALGVGLAAVVLALVQSRAWSGATDCSWSPLRAWLRSTPSGGSSTGSREPIVDFELFRNRPYLGASAAAFALVGAYWAVMFFQPQYLQDVAGHSAVLSGLLILPITAPMVVISPFSARLIGALRRARG